MLPEGCHGDWQRDGGWEGKLWDMAHTLFSSSSLPPLAGLFPCTGVGVDLLLLGRWTERCTLCFHSHLLSSVDDPGKGDRNFPLLLMKRDLTYFVEKCCLLAARVLGDIPSYCTKKWHRNISNFPLYVRILSTNFSVTAEPLVFFNTSEEA